MTVQIEKKFEIIKIRDAYNKTSDKIGYVNRRLKEVQSNIYKAKNQIQKQIEIAKKKYLKKLKGGLDE